MAAAKLQYTLACQFLHLLNASKHAATDAPYMLRSRIWRSLHARVDRLGCTRPKRELSNLRSQVQSSLPQLQAAFILPRYEVALADIWHCQRVCALLRTGLRFPQLQLRTEPRWQGDANGRESCILHAQCCAQTSQRGTRAQLVGLCQVCLERRDAGGSVSTCASCKLHCSMPRPGCATGDIRRTLQSHDLASFRGRHYGRCRRVHKRLTILAGAASSKLSRVQSCEIELEHRDRRHSV